MSERFSAAGRWHRELLRGVRVRPILPEERGRWDALMRSHHYLGLRSLFGKSLRYVALFEGHWLALLGWQVAALKCRPRDRWIGWPRVLQYQRLHLIANNARFLVLPGVRVPNLASRVLALNLRRLSKDWEAVYGHPLWLAETFVDARFSGTCYRAANWQALGHTRGFARSNGHYVAHARPKQVLVYPLHPKAREFLCDPTLQAQWRTPMQTVSLTSAQMEDLYTRLQALPDARKPRGLRHRLATVLTLAMAALLAGNRGYTAIAEWAARLTQPQLKRLRARYNHTTGRFEAPSEPTVRRVLQDADAAAVDAAFGDWMLATAGPDDAIAVDGKTLRGATRDNGTQVHLLSAFLQGQGVTVAQREVGEKTNEIPEIKPLLEPLDLTGRVVTADALHTRAARPRAIWSRTKAPIISSPSRRTRRACSRPSRLFARRIFPRSTESLDKGHGRLEVRRLAASTALNEHLDFPYLSQVCRIEREVTYLKTGKTRTETVYAITDLTPDEASPERLLALNRGHWAIENRSHYVRDVTFGEDHSQTRTANGPRVMASLRNFAIGLLRLLGVTEIASQLRECAHRPHLALRLLGV